MGKKKGPKPEIQNLAAASREVQEQCCFSILFFRFFYYDG